MPKVLAGQHWRTLDRQPTAYQLHGVYHLRIRVAKQRADRSKFWKEFKSTDWKPGCWVTEAAALAARPQFKHWVDYDMNAAQRAGQSEASSSRSPAAINALLRPPAPTRASERLRSRVFSVHVSTGLKAGGGKVQLTLTVGQHVLSDVDDGELLSRYRKRSADALERAVKRRKYDMAKRNGSLFGAEAVAVPSWADILKEDCGLTSPRPATSTRRVARFRPRGASHANRVSVKKRARTDRHVQREEERAVRLQAQVKAAKAYRAAQVQKLR